MSKKYKILKHQSIRHNGRILYKIMALIDIPAYNVLAGDIGGYIEKEENLSHIGSCWVSGNAKVYDDAMVIEKGFVYDNAEVFENACVSMGAKVSESSKVSGRSLIGGLSHIFGVANVSGYANIGGRAWVFDEAEVSGDAIIHGDACICGNVCIHNGCIISDALIRGDKNFMYFNSFNHKITFFTTVSEIYVVENNNKWKLSDWKERRSSHSKELKIIADMVENYFITYGDIPLSAKDFVKRFFNIREK